MRDTTWYMAACVVMLLVPAPLHGQDPVLQVPGVREYVHQVLVGNAGYAAARSRVAAAGARIAPAGALPDPTLTFGIIAVPTPSFDFGAERMTRLPIGLRQQFPFPGKQAASTALARADSAILGESLNAIEAGLVAEAAGVYYELAYAETVFRVWRSRVALADQAIAAAQTRYETGTAPQTDLLRARLRRAELEEEGWDLEATVAQVRAHADALRGGGGDTIAALVLLNPDGRPAVEIRRDTLAAERLIVQLTERSPGLRVATARVTRAQRNARVFDVAGRPDFTVTLESGIRFGGREPFTTALVGISIPLWSKRKQGPAARAAHHDVEAARQQHSDLLARLIGELRGRLADLGALQARTGQTADEIIPLADAASTSALQRYQVGAVEFTTVLDTQDDMFGAQLRLARLIAEYGTARAQLAALVGEEWYR